MNRTVRLAASLLLLLAGMTTAMSGCTILGYASTLIPPADVAPAYKGLMGHTVGILVYSDRATQVDFPSINLDIASAIQGHLKGNKSKDLTGTQFLNPAAIVHWQEGHPEFETMPVEDIAPRLGVERVIYIEVESFDTRSPESVDLYLGSIQASVRVLEIENGAVKVGYSEDNLRVTYPPKNPNGVPKSDTADSYTMYQKTVALFGDTVANRFYTHPGEDQ